MTRSMTVEGQGTVGVSLRVTLEGNTDPFLPSVRALPLRWWNSNTKTWRVAVDTSNVQGLRRLYASGFPFDDAAVQVLRGFTGKATPTYTVTCRHCGVVETHDFTCTEVGTYCGACMQKGFVPPFAQDIEAEMHRMEAQADREQTIREETAKAQYKMAVEG